MGLSGFGKSDRTGAFPKRDGVVPHPVFSCSDLFDFHNGKGEIAVRLVLSSCDFHNDRSKRQIFDNLGTTVEDCRILFIPNEKATPAKLADGR